LKWERRREKMKVDGLKKRGGESGGDSMTTDD
jgi:hypothetical protein